jgi:hypothetical protein
LKRVRRPRGSREECKSSVSNTVVNQFIELKSIKQKKKLIDKLLKMRQDSEDMPLGKRGGSSRMGIINE